MASWNVLVVIAVRSCWQNHVDIVQQSSEVVLVDQVDSCSGTVARPKLESGG